MNFEKKVEMLSKLAASAMLNPMIEMKMDGSFELPEAFNLETLSERMAKHFVDEVLELSAE